MMDRFNPADISENAGTRLCIGGKWTVPRSSNRLEIISPITEKVQFTVPAGSPEDMDDGVKAISEAFEQGPPDDAVVQAGLDGASRRNARLCGHNHQPYSALLQFCAKSRRRPSAAIQCSRFRIVADR
jgi:hypothetical protein